MFILKPFDLKKKTTDIKVEAEVVNETDDYRIHNIFQLL